MKVFLSWSGDRSRSIAETLRDTLRLLMNAVDPWMSDLDIDKGERWNTVLSEVLNSTKVGIFCLTPANIDRPALLFEAGAISKSVSDARVCVLLDGMQPSDLRWPWTQFQYTKLQDQKDMFKMLADVNRWLTEAGEPGLPTDQFARQLAMWWPEFQRELEAKPGDVKVHVPARSDKDMLVEVLELLRSQKREAIPLEIVMNELQVARMHSEKQAADLRQILEARLRDTLANSINVIRQAMIAALSREGHETAAAQLGVSRLTLSADGICTIYVPLRQAMMQLSFNDEARKIMLEAARSMGHFVPEVVLHPAVPPPPPPPQ